MGLVEILFYLVWRLLGCGTIFLALTRPPRAPTDPMTRPPTIALRLAI